PPARLSNDPEPRDIPDVRTTWQARGAPTPTDLLLSSLRERLTRPQRLLRSARQTASNPARLAKALRDTASGLATVAQTIRAPRSVINGPSGTSRAYGLTRFPLDGFKLVKQVF